MFGADVLHLLGACSYIMSCFNAEVLHVLVAILVCLKLYAAFVFRLTVVRLCNCLIDDNNSLCYFVLISTSVPYLNTIEKTVTIVF